MAQITFEVPDENVLEVLKAYAATLNAVTILEEDEEPLYPFSKEESDMRIAESRKQLREKGGISLEQLQININDFKVRKLNGL